MTSKREQTPAVAADSGSRGSELGREGDCIAARSRAVSEAGGRASVLRASTVADMAWDGEGEDEDCGIPDGLKVNGGQDVSARLTEKRQE